MAEQPISGRLRFDPVVTWGHVLIFIGFIVSAIGVYFANELRTTDLSYRIATLERMDEERKRFDRELINELKTLKNELVNIRIKMGPDQSAGGYLYPGSRD